MTLELNQQLPTLAPLEHSGSVGVIEDELRRITLDLYRSLLSADDYDINLLGMPHLAGINLVRREIDADGLLLLRSDNDEYLTRYLYRAWKGRNRNGRGLHFIRLYMRILFGEFATVTQIHKSATTGLENGIRPDWYMPHLNDHDLSLDGSWRLGDVISWRTPGFISDPNDVYPSNRVRIAIDYQQVDPSAVDGLKSLLRKIMHIRLVPVIELQSSAIVDAVTEVYS
jgi:hypothetical protein